MYIEILYKISVVLHGYLNLRIIFFVLPPSKSLEDKTPGLEGWGMHYI